MGGCGDKCRNIGLAICNPKEGTFLGRTCKSWTLIFIYYCIYYACLAGFWVGMLSCLLYGVMDDHVPSLTGKQSLLKLEPGIGFLPPVDTEATLMRVPTYDTAAKAKYLQAMTDILGNYSTTSACDFDTSTRTGDFITEPCKFPITRLGPCENPSTYMQTNNNICIYMKMNRIYGFLPDINGTDIEVTCTPANPHDKYTLGEATFYPSKAGNTSIGIFSSVVFPYVNQANYQDQLLAVVFPNIKKNAITMVSCQMTNMGNGDGYRFDLLVEDSPPRV